MTATRPRGVYVAEQQVDQERAERAGLATRAERLQTDLDALRAAPEK